MVDLNSLVIFARIVEAGSFSEAARRMNMPISTVSRRLADLEDSLGVRLLERSTRSLRLTDIGSEILQDAQKSASLSEAVDDSVSCKRNTVSGNLRISGPPNISASVLTPLALMFQASYPDVRIRIITTDRSIDHIHDEIDLAFAFGSLKNSSLIAQKVLACRPHLVASRAYVTRFGFPETPKSLQGHRLLTSSHLGLPDAWTFTHEDGIEVETVDISPQLVVSDTASLVPALLAGEGIGSQLWLEDGNAEPDDLVNVLPNWRLPPCNLSIVYPGSRNISRPMRSFRDFALKTTPQLFAKRSINGTTD